MELESIKLQQLNPAKYNPRYISDEELNKLRNNLQEFGLVDPIIIDLTDNNTIIGGHQRYKALLEDNGPNEKYNLIRLGDIGWVFEDKEIKIKDTNHQKALNLSLNKISGEWDFPKLDELLDELNSANFNMDLTGFEVDIPVFDQTITNPYGPSVEEDAPLENERGGTLVKQFLNTESGTLQRDFIVPPFTILSTRKKEWQNRKQMWDDVIRDKGETRENILGSQEGNSKFGVSLFDSCLAEILIKWFTPTDNINHITDPFSGDSIIGCVSSALNNLFTGIELRQEQCDLNNERVALFSEDSKYFCDDGRNILNYVEQNSQDLLISCPPYYDLEVYSDLENDASNQETYEEFYKILDVAFSNAIQTLKDNRFAVIIVGDVRDKKGFYYDFPGDIIKTFKNNGLNLYNKLILENQAGSAALRARSAFKNRKITKIHQDILVFYKGNPSNIKNDFGELNGSWEELIDDKN